MLLQLLLLLARAASDARCRVRSLHPTGSDSEEVGSKGNAGSTFGDQGENKSNASPL